MQEEKTTAVKFSETLKGLMGERGISQVDLAENLGITQAAVSKWMRGSVPRGELFTRLSAFFGVPSDYLLTGKEELRVPKAPEPPNYTKKSPVTGTHLNRDEIEEEAEKTIPQRLRWLRESLGLSIQQFAKKCGYSPGYISRLEGSKRVNPSWKFIEALVVNFAVSRQWIQFGIGEPFVAGTISVAQSTAENLKRLNQRYNRDKSLYFFRTGAELLKTSAILDLMQTFWQEASRSADPVFYREALAELSRIQAERMSGAVKFDEEKGLTLDSFLLVMSMVDKLADYIKPPRLHPQPISIPALAEDDKRYFEGKRQGDLYPVKAEELVAAVKAGIPIENLRLAVDRDENGQPISPPLVQGFTPKQLYLLLEWSSYWRDKERGLNPVEPPHFDPSGDVSKEALQEFLAKQLAQSQAAQQGRPAAPTATPSVPPESTPSIAIGSPGNLSGEKTRSK